MARLKKNWFERNTGAWTFLATLTTFLALIVSSYVMVDQKEVSSKNLDLATRQTEYQEAGLITAKNQHVQDSISFFQQSNKKDSIDRASFRYQDSIYKVELLSQKAEVRTFQDIANIASEQYLISLKQIKKTDSLRLIQFAYQDSINKRQIAFYQAQYEQLTLQNKISTSLFIADSLKKEDELSNSSAFFTMAIKKRKLFESAFRAEGKTLIRFVSDYDINKYSKNQFWDINFKNVGRRAASDLNIKIFFIEESKDGGLNEIDSAETDISQIVAPQESITCKFFWPKVSFEKKTKKDVAVQISYLDFTTTKVFYYTWGVNLSGGRFLYTSFDEPYAELDPETIFFQKPSLINIWCPTP